MTTTPPPTNTLQELLTEHEVARLLKVSVATIRRRRLSRQPPMCVKIGASVRYRPETIAAFLDSAPAGGGDPRLTQPAAEGMEARA
jgi:predicted DNA-binding transcriptional regulator AlpA